MRRRVAALAALSLLAVLPAAPAVAAAPRTFVDLATVDPTIMHDIRYRQAHNFVGRPIKGYREPLCVLTHAAARALKTAQSALRGRGYSLKVYDCYRPQRAVDDFGRWAAGADQTMKREFYPRVDKRTLFDDGYLARRSGHSRGSTVDLTIVRLPAAVQPAYRPGQPLAPCYAPVGVRFPDNGIDMGTGYDCFDTLSATLDPRVGPVARANRLLLHDAMAAVGFKNYAGEWWHYTLIKEPYRDTYFDFPVARAALTR